MITVPVRWRRRFALVSGAVLLALSLGACSTAEKLFQGRDIDYKSSGTLPPLEIPPDLTSPTRDDRYIVPDSGKSATTFSVHQAQSAQRQREGAGGVLPKIDNMRVERQGNQRWLVVGEAPQKLWELVKDFWQENGFLVRTELPEAGIMETDWAENRAKLPQDFIRSTVGRLFDQLYSTGERDKFRTRFEPTADGKGTEIYISHRGMVEVYINQERDQTSWQPRAPDPGLEAEFLRRLMVRLGAQEETAKAIAASSGGRESRATLKKDGSGAQVLEVLEPFDRAWRRVGLALDRVGFTVEDRDRQQGLYFVRYADPEAEMDRKSAEKPGLLSKLAFWRSSPEKVKAEQYRVVVAQASENSEIRVLNKAGGAEQSATVSRILSLLHEQLR